MNSKTTAEFNAERQRLMQAILQVGDCFNPENAARLSALQAQLKQINKDAGK